MIYPVDNLDDAYNACNPNKPLSIDDPRYLDLTSVRSPQSISVLTKRIVRAQPEQRFHKQLFSGHRGSGKSTELHRLEGELQNKGYVVIFLDVGELLDLAEITYQDILLMIATGIVKILEEQKIDLDKGLLDDLQTWFATRIITQVYAKDESLAVKARAELALKTPFSKILTNLQAEVRSASGWREEVRQTLENELPVFIAKLNDLILAARIQFKKKDFVDMVIIVDGLEKMYYRLLANDETSYSNLFIRHAEQLNAPQSHIIYTVPIALAFNSNLGNEFSAPLFMMPMIKYQTSLGETRLIELINQRMRSDLFESANLQKQLIAMSGGSMRDLFRLIQFATETTNEKIKAADVKLAIQTLAKEYDRLVQDDFLPYLKAVKKNKNLPSDTDKIFERVLDLRLVHEYENGERWADLHSILSQISRLDVPLSLEDES